MAWQNRKKESRFGGAVRPPNSWRFAMVEVKTPGGKLGVGECYYRHDAPLDSLGAYLEGDSVHIVRLCRVTGAQLGGASLQLTPAASASSWVTPAVGEDDAGPSTTKWSNEAGWIFRLVGNNHETAYLEAPARAD